MKFHLQMTKSLSKPEGIKYEDKLLKSCTAICNVMQFKKKKKKNWNLTAQGVLYIDIQC